ncbi:Yip1 domain protein [Candidatus Gugararchaeum adminiculabundum]|nr:Yip1 domain protein [Candidatus Gugararchaeum adminiculabundum]
MIGIGLNIGIWIDGLMYPSRYFKEIEGREDAKRIAKNILIAGVLMGLVPVILQIILLKVFPGQVLELTKQQQPEALEVVKNLVATPLTELIYSGAITTVLSAIVTSIGLFMLFGFTYLLSLALGSRGKIMTQYHYQAALLVPITIGWAILTLILGVVLGLAALLLYLIYPMSIALRETHKMATWKAVLISTISIFMVLYLSATLVRPF